VTADLRNLHNVGLHNLYCSLSKAGSAPWSQFISEVRNFNTAKGHDPGI
jgi:hypothetical protein